jgi:chromate reductase
VHLDLDLDLEGRNMPRVLALSGSLRRDSMNSLLLRTLPALSPVGLKWDTFDGLGDLPIYDQDRDTETPPPPVARLRAAIAAADGLVIATPEYNHSIPGVLKNAIDWASRPVAAPALTGKGVGILVATSGRASGFRALAEATKVLNNLSNIVVPSPELVINTAHTVVGRTPAGEPTLSDPVAARLIRVHLNVLAELLANDVPRLLLRSIQRHHNEHFAAAG